MHRVLYFIVRAESDEQALETAQETFEDELAENHTYDYCKPMEGGHTVAGSDRWNQFADEPIAAPITDSQAQEWLAQARDYTERHFAENLYGFFQYMLEQCEDSVETAPDAISQILEFVRDNREDMSWSDGGKELREVWPNTIETLHSGGGMHRHYAGRMGEDDPFTAHIMDAYTYSHLSVVDSRIHLENVKDLLDEQPDDAWVVPLDTHF